MITCRGEYWFPLALLGLLLLALTGWDVVGQRAWYGDTPGPGEPSFGWFSYAPLSGSGEPDVQYSTSLFSCDTAAECPPRHGEPGMQFLSQENYAELMAEHAWPVGLVGLAVVLNVFLFTVLWYAVRTHVTGHTVAAGRLALFTVCGAGEIGLVHWTAREAHGLLDPQSTVVAVLLFGALAACAAIWAVTAGDRTRRPATVTATVLAWAALCVVPVALAPHAVDLLLVVGGLLALAWWERSVLLAVVTAVFLMAAMDTVSSMSMVGVWPAAVLLVGAFAALVLRVRRLERRWTMER